MKLAEVVMLISCNKVSSKPFKWIPMSYVVHLGFVKVLLRAEGLLEGSKIAHKMPSQSVQCPDVL